MNAKRWMIEQEPKWRRLEALLGKAQVGVMPLAPGEIREMALLYRDTINALSRAQSSPDLQHLEPYLNSLAQRGHARIYEAPPTGKQSVRKFFLNDFPCCFRKNIAFIALALIMFALGTVVALLTVHLDPQTERFFLPPNVIEQLDRGVLWTDNIHAKPSESSFLMTNNIRVAINAFAFGIFFGVGTLVLLFQNGLFAFGGPLGVCLQHGMGFRLLNFITAHGVIELTTIFIAGGAGMAIGFALLFPGELPRWEAVRQKGREAVILIGGCVPLLVIAGLIEGLISLNGEIGPVPRLAVALLSLVFLVVYLGSAGRRTAEG